MWLQSHLFAERVKDPSSLKRHVSKRKEKKSVTLCALLYSAYLAGNRLCGCRPIHLLTTRSTLVQSEVKWKVVLPRVPALFRDLCQCLCFVLKVIFCTVHEVNHVLYMFPFSAKLLWYRLSYFRLNVRLFHVSVCLWRKRLWGIVIYFPLTLCFTRKHWYIEITTSVWDHSL